jgi:glycosyltransferase involved in cell wall biosynthesis
MVTNMWPHERNPGYGIFVHRQIESLQASGLECDVLFIEGYRSRWDYARAALYMLRLNWSKSRPLLVHSHGGETAVSLCWYVRGRVLLSYCGSDVLGEPSPLGKLLYWSRPRRFILQEMARHMSATVTKSAEMDAVLPKRARARNVVVPNGVDHSLFRPVPRDLARCQLGWPSGDRIVLFAADPGRRRKRYWLAEAACREAERRIGPVRLIVAWGIPPDAIPLYMSAADCLLLTSSIEGSPNVVKEAMACDLPVISTDVGDVREMLRAVEPSWICPPVESELATAVAACFMIGRRSNGRERSEWLGEERIAARLFELYRHLVPELGEALPQAVASERAIDRSDVARGVDDSSLPDLVSGPVNTVQR